MSQQQNITVDQLAAEKFKDRMGQLITQAEERAAIAEARCEALQQLLGEQQELMREQQAELERMRQQRDSAGVEEEPDPPLPGT